MSSQESSSTGYRPHELIHGGRPAWFFKAPFPEDYKSPVGDWLEHRQDLANLARAKLKQVREHELTRRDGTRHPATFKVGDLVLVHHSRLPTWPRNCLQDPYFGPYCTMKIHGSRIHVIRLGTFCEIGNRLLFKLQILQPVIGQILHFKTGTYRLLGVENFFAEKPLNQTFANKKFVHLKVRGPIASLPHSGTCELGNNSMTANVTKKFWFRRKNIFTTTFPTNNYVPSCLRGACVHVTM